MAVSASWEKRRTTRTAWGRPSAPAGVAAARSKAASGARAPSQNAGGDQMQEVSGQGQAAVGLHRRGMPGPGQRSRRAGREQPALHAQGGPVRDGVLSLAQEEQGGEKQDHARAQEPHRAELRGEEHADPGRGLERRADASRHMRRLQREGSTPEPSAASAARRLQASMRASQARGVGCVARPARR